MSFRTRLQCLVTLRWFLTPLGRGRRRQKTSPHPLAPARLGTLRREGVSKARHPAEQSGRTAGGSRQEDRGSRCTAARTAPAAGLQAQAAPRARVPSARPGTCPLRAGSHSLRRNNERGERVQTSRTAPATSRSAGREQRGAGSPQPRAPHRRRRGTPRATRWNSYPRLRLLHRVPSCLQGPGPRSRPPHPPPHRLQPGAWPACSPRRPVCSHGACLRCCLLPRDGQVHAGSSHLRDSGALALQSPHRQLLTPGGVPRAPSFNPKAWLAPFC